MQLNDVDVVVVVPSLQRGTDPGGIGLEKVEADLERFLGGTVCSESRGAQLTIARCDLRLKAVEPEVPAGACADGVQGARVEWSVGDDGRVDVEGSTWYFTYTTANGQRKTRAGTTDKAATQRMASRSLMVERHYRGLVRSGQAR